MAVIAMTREMGTLGKDVAAGLALTLDIEVVHHELVERQLAERLQTSESAVHRFLEGESSMWERWKIDLRRLSRFTAEEILQLTQKGNVLIRGWGAAQLLADIPHVVCVRIFAPMANRIAEMKRRLNIDDDAIVRREIERSDDAHARTIQRQFGIDWRDPASYDIVLNTGRIPIDACVRQIRLLADCPTYEETDDTRAMLQDKLVKSRVRTVVDRDFADAPYGSALRVSVSGGVATISGVTTSARDIDPIIDEIRSIDGVLDVRNDIHYASMPGSAGV
ncbi:MAG: cytidylate kinase family protein [Hyphomicrobiaceae bacterium]